MTKDKERDDALIAEKKRLAEQLQIFAYGLGSSPSASMMLQAAAILRDDEPAKPDRAEVLASIVLDLARTDFNSDDLDEREPEAVAIIRRHFDELRAEWEAEQEVVPRDVAESWKARADNLKEDRENLLSNLAIMMSKHVENWPEPRRFSTAIALLDKTLTEALTKREAERPAVVVPREAKLWADSVGYCSATRYEERTTAKWIKSLDGAKGPAVVVPEETGWLVETKFGPHIHYMGIKDPHPYWRESRKKDEEFEPYGRRALVGLLSFNKDSNDGLRFARKVDAEAFIAAFGQLMTDPKATEHIWADKHLIDGAKGGE